MANLIVAQQLFQALNLIESEIRFIFRYLPISA
jgi:hypothetical protein